VAGGRAGRQAGFPHLALAVETWRQAVQEGEIVFSLIFCVGGVPSQRATVCKRREQWQERIERRASSRSLRATHVPL